MPLKLDITKVGSNQDIAKTHPCFSKEAHHKFGRIHLPVAPACNIQCKYCVRKYDCANESRPGITSKVMHPREAVERVRMLMERNDRITVIGIAGPGDPLANDTTFEALSAINREFPELTLCVSTNGLLLTDRLQELMKCRVRSLTITMNAVTPEIAEKIYVWVSYGGKKYMGREAAELLVFNQARGLRNAIDAGFMVKINSVFIPGVNSMELPLVAWLAGMRGADIMNVLPLIPQGDFEHLLRPPREMIDKMRGECVKYIPQMTHCRQCRADAFGILGEDKDMELEAVNASIGEDYCDMVS
ncbi:MAG TPA: nitrogenase molybdenum-iron cofactor biosynthesis protein [Nitrospiraceae bacterium]|nr:nitrogenase molybdenum-iron cofactor biosynthesis protein [Nitrospiraceae bacterium]